MSVINDPNGHTYTISEILSGVNLLIIREGATSDVTDDFLGLASTGADLIQAVAGVNDNQYNQNNFSLKILNNTDYSITQNTTAVGLSFSPISSIIIPPRGSATYTFTQTTSTTMIVYISDKYYLSSLYSLGVLNDAIIQGNCTANQYLTTSDRRFKKNIEDISQDELSKLLELRSYKYNLVNDQDNLLRYGFIAQDLEESGLDHLVTEVEGVKRVDYTSTIPMLLSIIKQLEERVSDLENRF